MGNLGFGELLIILLVILVFFGGKKIPEIAKSIGEGIHALKKSMNGDENKSEKKD